jgi:hypothetical protein
MRPRPGACPVLDTRLARPGAPEIPVKPRPGASPVGCARPAHSVAATGEAGP